MNFSHKIHVKRSVTPKQNPNYKALKNYLKQKKTKAKIKVFSRYQNSNTHLNELINKMRYFKTLLNKTSDLKSLLLLDTYGLKYSNELRNIINRKKKFFSLSKHNQVLNQPKEKNENKKIKSKLFLSFNKKIKNKKEEGNNNENAFDLSNIMITNNEKALNNEFFTRLRKNKKLLNLKAQIFYFDKGRFFSNKKNNNIEYLRSNIKKNIYNKIKSKYKRPKTTESRVRNNITKSGYNLNSFDTNHFYNNNLNEISDSMDYYQELIKISNLKNGTNIENNKSGLYKSPRVKSAKIPIKQKFKQIIFSNDFKESTPSNNNSEYISKNIFNNKSNDINNISIFARQNQKYFLDKLNKLENKSNIINQNFSYFSNKSQEIGKKFFDKSFQKNDNSKNNAELNIKEINQYFNFSKGFENNLENLLKKNANKVKKIIDTKGGRILDKVIKEMCFEERKLNKNYFLKDKEDKPESKAKILKKYRELFSEKSDDILDIFQNKEKDFFNDIKSNVDYVNDIQILYEKTKIIKK